jgi:hypothetical protein
VKAEPNSSHHHNATSAFIREFFLTFSPMLPPNTTHFELMLCMVWGACNNSHRVSITNPNGLGQAKGRQGKKKKHAILL